MGFRFRKSINLGKGLKLNIGKSSIGFSAGVKGARVSLNSNGRKTTSVGIPGTGISFVNSSKIFSSNKKDNTSTSFNNAGNVADNSENMPSNSNNYVTPNKTDNEIFLSALLPKKYKSSKINNSKNAKENKKNGLIALSVVFAVCLGIAITQAFKNNNVDTVADISSSLSSSAVALYDGKPDNLPSNKPAINITPASSSSESVSSSSSSTIVSSSSSVALYDGKPDNLPPNPPTIIITPVEKSASSSATNNAIAQSSTSSSVAASSSSKATITYVLNTSTKKIHMPNCSSVKKIKPENYSESTNYDECIAQGYEPCQICDAHD